MSLINDALRRANSQSPSDTQSAAPVPAMQPVENVRRTSPIVPWAVLLLGVGVLLVGAALWFRGRPQETRQLAQTDPAPVQAVPASLPAPAQSSAATTPTPTPAAIDPQPVQQVSPAVVPAASTVPPPQTARVTPPPQADPQPILPSSPTAVAPAPSQPVATPSAVASVPSEVRTPEVKVAAAVPAPVETRPSASASNSDSPRLQAIYYRLRKPTVVINGKTLSPGESTDGIKVVSIQRTSVEVVQNGKYRTLTMQH